jgi:hypothetical protein
MKKNTYKIPLQLVPIESDGYHLMVEGKISRHKIRLLVDTGASKTVFDKTRLAKILKVGQDGFESSEHLSTGLGVNNMASEITTLNGLKIGDIKINDLPVVVLDLSHVNYSYKMIGDKGIDGVLGSDLLVLFFAVIQFHPPMLKLTFYDE